MRFAAKRLAITGGPGEGKSTVLSYLRDAGFETASSDVFARELWESASFRLQVGALLGVDRQASPDEAREAMASDPSFRRALNRISHPQIVEAMLRSLAQAFEVPLLVETCLHPLFERVWLVTCGPELQEQRLFERYGNLSTVRKFIASQLPNEVKSTFADRILRTNVSEACVRANVLEALAEDFGQIDHRIG